MTEIIGIRFKEVGKVYYFAPAKNKVTVGQKVIVETSRGVECGEVVIPNREVDDNDVVAPLKPIIRIATKDDEKRIRDNAAKEDEIMKTFTRKIAEHKLNMKPIDVEYTFDGSKILFYFSAEGNSCRCIHTSVSFKDEVEVRSYCLTDTSDGFQFGFNSAGVELIKSIILGFHRTVDEDLGSVEALCLKFLILFAEIVDIIRMCHDGSIDTDLVSCLTAEQLIYRYTQGFTLDIPAGNINC